MQPEPMVQQPEIQLEDVARFPLPGFTIPVQLAFSPDDRFITYLFSPRGDLVKDLYAYDPDTGEARLLIQMPGAGVTEETMTIADALRRERTRQVELGVTHYAWAKNKNRLLLPLGGDLYVAEPDSNETQPAPVRRLAAGGEHPLQDACFSPDGEWIAYVQSNEIWVVPFSGGEPRQITHGVVAGRTRGLAEYIAQEEMHRFEGFWWSVDSRSLAFVEVDETHIPVYRIVHQGKEFVDGIVQEDHRYPFAGCPNALVRLGVASIDSGDPVWMDLGPETDIYLARVGWLPDGRLTAQVQNRSQTRLDLIAFDPQTGRPTVLLTESSNLWINLNDLFRPLEKSLDCAEGAFLWASERDGFQHLFLYAGDGKLIRRLTAGEWIVEAVAGIDETAGLVYFTATRDDPRRRHLYAVPLGGGEPRRITATAGVHEALLDHRCRRFLDTHSAIEAPPSVRLYSLLDGRLLATLPAAQNLHLDPHRLQPPEMVELTNRHGDRLYGAVFRPSARYGPGPYPTVVFTYGGPHQQLVVDAWSLTAAMRPQFLRGLGLLVFVLDNRGSARRGLAFEGAIRGDLGHAEVEDQQDGVGWLVQNGLADPQRVAIYGWSYGGYLAAMCLARAPETFTAAVAGAPVTHWDGYDTHYTERYMGTPQSNPDGYRESSVMAHVSRLRGDLLIVHGLIDENVHFRHTARLINALTAARKPYELMIFPDERHLPRSLADRVFMEERIVEFLMERLVERSKR